MIARLKQRCDLLADAVQQRHKGEVSLVDSQFQKTTSLFVDKVDVYCLPEKFKLLEVLVYIGLGDPIEHLDDFRAHLDLLRESDEVACRACPLRLSRSARGWFQNLPSKSVNNFDDFGKMFLTQFIAGIVQKKPVGP
jgi:hypothetical protein